MAKDINLLPRLMEEEVKRSEYQRVGSFFSFSLIGLVLVVLVGLFIFLLILDNSIKNTSNDIGNREQSIKDNIDKELKQRALSSKVKLIAPVVNASYGYSDVVTNLQTILQNSTSVEPSELIVQGNEVSFSAHAPGSQPIQDFFTALLSPGFGGKNFSKVVLNSLNRSENLNEYRFSISMLFSPSKKGGADSGNP